MTIVAKVDCKKGAGSGDTDAGILLMLGVEVGAREKRAAQEGRDDRIQKRKFRLRARELVAPLLVSPT